MPAMNYWAEKWDLHVDVCPCDVHVNDWLAENKIKDSVIYHFGTGTHHVVGEEQATNGSGNKVVSITASIEEYESYIKLVTENARIGKSYLAYFGDIYLTEPRMLPDFDVVTMVHLCEFFSPEQTSAEYGGIDDRGVLDAFTGKTRSGGHILFYMNSNGYEASKPIIAQWERDAPVTRVGEFKTLLVYRKD